jgi:hypothetical protein
VTDHCLPLLDLGGASAPVTTLENYMQEDARRAEGFITNFGTWHLPPSAATVMRTLVAHLEWAHDTGELFLIGALPIIGEGSVDVPPALAASAALGSIGGGETVLSTYREVSPGLVREFFPAETVPAGTSVAVLATITHGWTVHEALWGWHIHQNNTGGWEWLLERLRAHRASATG